MKYRPMKWTMLFFIWVYSFTRMLTESEIKWDFMLYKVQSSHASNAKMEVFHEN